MSGTLQEIAYIQRSMLRASPRVLFVFGDNLQQGGLGGQAKEMRGEPNAVGIPTKKAPSMRESAFFSDADFQDVKPHIDAPFSRLEQHLLSGGTVAWPKAGIGTGLSQLPQRAPHIAAYILTRIERLKNIVANPSRENPSDWNTVYALRRLAQGSPEAEASEADKREQRSAARKAALLANKLTAAGVPEPGTAPVPPPPRREAQRRRAPRREPSIVHTVISGGQTGGDQGGLRAAKQLGIRTGGWAPIVAGVPWATQYKDDAPLVSDPTLETLYGLRLHPKSGWPARTDENAKSADGTLWFGKDSAGYRRTRTAAKKLFPVSWAGGEIPNVSEFVKWLQQNDIHVLNVAGNREGSNPGIGSAVESFLVQALPLAVKVEKEQETEESEAPSAGTSPRSKTVVLPMQKEFVPLVLEGKKTLTSRSPEATRKIGLAVGETAIAQMLAKGTKPSGAYIRMLGTYATGDELIEAAGGMAEYSRKEGLRLNESEIRKLEGWSLFELSLQPFPGQDAPEQEQKEAKGPVSLPSIDLGLSQEAAALVVSGDKTRHVSKKKIPPGYYTTRIQDQDIYIDVGDAYTLEQVSASVGGARRLLTVLGYAPDDSLSDDDLQKQLLSLHIGDVSFAAWGKKEYPVQVLHISRYPQKKDVHVQKEQRAKGARVVLPEHKPAASPPDLYLLPITPPQLWAYIQATLLFLSDRDEVATVVAQSPSFVAAANALRSMYNLDEYQARQKPYEKDVDVGDQTRVLISLRLKWLPGPGLSWDDVKGDQVPKGFGWSSHGKLVPPSFGVYSLCFGAPGSDASILSCFGSRDVARAGAASLTDVYTTWNRSRKGGSIAPSPYLFQRANGSTYALVIAGRFDLWEPYYPGESTERGNNRPQNQDNLPVYQALAAVREATTAPTLSVCLLLPTADLLTDATRQDDYKAYTLQLQVPEYLKQAEQDLLHLTRGPRWVGPHSREDDTAARRDRLQAERDTQVQQEQKRSATVINALLKHPPSFLEEKCTPLRFFGSERAIREWPALFIGSVIGFQKRPSWLRNRYSREDVQKHLQEEELTFYDFILAAQDDEDKKGVARKWYALQQVPPEKPVEDITVEGEAGESGSARARKLNLGDLPYEDLAEITFIQDLVTGFPNIKDGLNAAPLVPGKITLYRGQRDALGAWSSAPRATQLLVQPHAWAQYVRLASGEEKVKAEPGEKLKQLLPMVVATVGLYRSSVVKVHMKQRSREALDLLKRQGKRLEGMGEDWYIAIPASWVNQAGPNEPENPRHYFYSCGPSKILQVAQNLLRVRVGHRPEGGYTLQPASTNWTSTDAPYLIDRLPYSSEAEREAAKKEDRAPLSDSIAKIWTPQYRDAVASAFATSKKPPQVVGGRVAVHVGMVGGGGTAVGRGRPRDASPAVKMGYRESGLYLLANRALKLRVASPYRDIGPLAEGIVFRWNKDGTASALTLNEATGGGPGLLAAREDVQTARHLVLRQFADGSIRVLAPEELRREQAYPPNSPEAKAVAKRFGTYTLPEVRVESRGRVYSLHNILRENWYDILKYINFYRKLREEEDVLGPETDPPVYEEDPTPEAVRLELEALEALHAWSSGKLGKDFTRAMWPAILHQINVNRSSSGLSPLAATTPCPFERGSTTAEDVSLIEEAVIVVNASPFGRSASGKTMFGNSALVRGDLMRPWKEHELDQDKQYLPQEYEHYLDDQTVDVIKAIENGQRRRRQRRARRSRRIDALDNPLTKEEVQHLTSWAESPRDANLANNARLQLEARPLNPHASEQGFAEGVRAFFPQRTYKKPTPSSRALKPVERFSALQEHDVVSRFDLPDVPPEAVDTGMQKRLSERADLLDDDAYRKYVADASQLSLAEALDLHKRRYQNKMDGSVVSPSGALCRMHRNSSRLRRYEPPAEMLQPSTCWIVVAPATPSRPARVMSYRNGTHVDCDMEVRQPRQLGLLLAKAVEGMILWLVEKEKRIERISSINLAQIGTSRYRVLWSRNRRTPLDTKVLLDLAYRGKAEQGSWNGEADWDRYLRALDVAVSSEAPRTTSFPSKADEPQAAPTRGGSLFDMASMASMAPGNEDD